MIARKPFSRMFETKDDEFERSIRQYFQKEERRGYQYRVAILAVLLWLSLVCNGAQFWLYKEALKICGVRP